MLMPSTTLRPGPPAELVRQAMEGLVQARMAAAESRRLLVEGDWRPLVWALLGRLGYSDKVRSALMARVKRSSNVLLKILRKVALAYKVPPTRSIQGASDEAMKAFARIVLEDGGLLTMPQRWERLVWAMNVVITVPVVYAANNAFGRRLGFEVLLPSNTEVVTPEDSPTARPIASVTAIVERGQHSIGVPQKWVVLDHQAWSTYDSEGNLQGRVEHRAGVWPGVEWRRDHGADWWCSEKGEGVVEACLEVSHIGARLDWIRQGQDHKRELLITEELANVPNQVAGTDGPVEVPIDPNNLRYEVHDAIVTVDQHLAHIQLHARDGAEALGIDADLLDFAAGPEGIEPLVAAQKHDDLMALRTATTVHFKKAEKELAWKTWLVLQGSGHPAASLLRPSQLADDYEATWSELDFVDHPETRLRVLEGEVNLGLKSTVDAYMAQHPGMTREQAKKEIRRIDEEEAERAEFLATRNIPRLVRDRRSNVAELQGRIGGMTGGEARREERDDTDRGSERSNDNSNGADDPERDRPTPSAGASADRRARGSR
jgi:hypothetical protein